MNLVLIAHEAKCGDVVIPRGEYLVALNASNSEIYLTGRGSQFKLPATKRRNNARTRVTSVQFYCGGGKTWSLVISTPKLGEWVAFLTYES